MLLFWFGKLPRYIVAVVGKWRGSLGFISFILKPFRLFY
jgi:hypothetical protein